MPTTNRRVLTIKEDAKLIDGLIRHTVFGENGKELAYAESKLENPPRAEGLSA